MSQGAKRETNVGFSEGDVRMVVSSKSRRWVST